MEIPEDVRAVLAGQEVQSGLLGMHLQALRDFRKATESAQEWQKVWDILIEYADAQQASGEVSGVLWEAVDRMGLVSHSYSVAQTAMRDAALRVYALTMLYQEQE